MDNPTALYSWQQMYVSAVLETDDANMRSRIEDAIAAMELRRLSPLEPDSAEDRALRAAETAIYTLIAERFKAA